MFNKKKITYLNTGTALLTAWGTQQIYADLSCPNGATMYFLGDTSNRPSNAVTPNNRSWSWTSGSSSNSFTFIDPTNGKTITLNMWISDQQGVSTNYPIAMKTSTSVSQADAPSGSVVFTLSNNSPKNVPNHAWNLTASVPVSKMGFRINDLDYAYDSKSGFYTEKMTVNLGNGSFTPTVSGRHQLSTNPTAVIAIGKCGTGDEATNCPVYADWTNIAANAAIKASHSNVTTATNGQYFHWVSYDNFYFCAMPARLFVNKLLDGNRVKTNDQLKVDVNNTATSPATLVKTFTTTGSGSTITNPTGTTGQIVLNRMARTHLRLVQQMQQSLLVKLV